MSMRWRMVVVGTSVVAVVVALTGMLVGIAIREELVDNADEVALTRAQQLSDLASRGLLPEQIARADEFEAAIQVLRGHQVISSTSNAPGADFFDLPPEPAGEDDVTPVDYLPIDDDGPYRVAAVGTTTPQGPATVYVAVDVEDIGEFLATLARKGAVGLTVLLVVFACALWLVVGRTIGSVEAIRRRAELITGRRLDERVPEPTTRDEIFRLARTLNDMLGRLERSAKRQERFVADAAHELRTPLTTLRTRLETGMLRNGGDPDPGLLSELWSQTVRMGSLVDQLLLLARSDAGTLPFLDQPVDLEDVLHDVLRSTPTGRISVRTVHVEPVQVRGNAALLEQVVRNLVENAVRHAASEIDLSSRSDGTTAVITVDDDGPGIPPADRADVFHRFVRLDDSRDRSRGGVGLGLAIVAEIVRIHSGSVQVTDSPAGGARFTVRLPAERRRAEHPASPERVTSPR
jgi:signal transduction histidine kinase